jgi:hypothetical protein
MARKIRDLVIGPERFDYQVVLPEQLLRRPNSQTGPRALMVAVLADAWRSVYGAQASYPKDNKNRVLRDALTWFFAPTTGWPFDFEVICDHLDLSADTFRVILRRRHDPTLRMIDASKLRKFRRTSRGPAPLDKIAMKA